MLHTLQQQFSLGKGQEGEQPSKQGRAVMAELKNEWMWEEVMGSVARRQRAE